SNRYQIIRFSYAAQKDIFVNINIVTNASFPIDGFDIIKSKVVEYINSLSMGQSVVYKRIEAIAFSIAGVVDVSVTLSTDNVTFTESNVIIAPMEVAQTTLDKL